MNTIAFNGQICRAVPGFVGYWVPESGAFVVSTKQGRPRRLAAFRDQDGYRIVRWGSRRGPALTLHHAVLLAWVGPRRGRLARHLDDVKANNRAGNLRWGTHIDNGRDKVKNGIERGENNSRAVLTESLVRQFRRVARRLGRVVVKRSIGLTRNAIRMAVSGASWKHLPGAARGRVAVVFK